MTERRSGAEEHRLDEARDDEWGRGVLAIREILESLAAKRPVFHSEADFQHALAWAIHHRHAELQVRLEIPVNVADSVLHLDVLASSPTCSYAIEIKYKTRAASWESGSDLFNLTNQAAQDLGRYDFIKDIARVERVVASRPATTGLSVLLTNDASYWRKGKPGSVDSAFRLDEGRVLSGTLTWDANAKPGTVRGREAPLNLWSSYQVAWRDYSTCGSGVGRTFRYLLVEVPAAVAG